MARSNSVWKPWGDHPVIVTIMVVAAVIGIAAVIVPWFNQDHTMEYVGRVLGQTSHAPIRGAKVTLDLRGAPPVVYTDSEGVYRFRLASGDENIAGRIRVDADGYDSYDRLISLSLAEGQIEDIRLSSSTDSVDIPSAPEPSSTLVSPTIAPTILEATSSTIGLPTESANEATRTQIFGRWVYVNDNSVWYTFYDNGTWTGTINGSQTGGGKYIISNGGKKLELSIDNAEGTISYNLTIDGETMVWIANRKYVLTFERVST